MYILFRFCQQITGGVSRWTFATHAERTQNRLSTHRRPTAGRGCSARSLGFYRLSLAGSSTWGLAYLHCWKEGRSIHWALGTAERPKSTWTAVRPGEPRPPWRYLTNEAKDEPLLTSPEKCTLYTFKQVWHYKNNHSHQCQIIFIMER